MHIISAESCWKKVACSDSLRDYIYIICNIIFAPEESRLVWFCANLRNKRNEQTGIQFFDKIYQVASMHFKCELCR
jgi:hypothetical protein